MKFPKKLYTAEQKAWCVMYQAETTFEPLMCDYVAGHQTFYEAARISVDWFESWSTDAHLKIGTRVPGAEAALDAEIAAMTQRMSTGDGGVLEDWNRTTSGAIGKL